MKGRNKMKLKPKNILTHFLMWICCFIVIYPLLIMLVTPFKTQMEVFKSPFGLPSDFKFDNFDTVFESGNFALYYKNSIFVTGIALMLIIIVSILASYVLSRWQFKGNKILYFYFLLGVMLPIRLGVIQLFNIFQKLGLIDTLWSLIIVYTAMGIPFSIFILTGFMKDIPKELEEAAIIDGCSSFKILLKIFIPLIRPAIATIAIYHFIPIWNDVYFPLVFIKNNAYKTIPLGVSVFFGQHQTHWPTVFAALSTAAIPVLVFYILMSKQFIKGLTAGAVKG